MGWLWRYREPFVGVRQDLGVLEVELRWITKTGEVKRRAILRGNREFSAAEVCNPPRGAIGDSDRVLLVCRKAHTQDKCRAGLRPWYAYLFRKPAVDNVTGIRKRREPVRRHCCCPGCSLGQRENQSRDRSRECPESGRRFFRGALSSRRPHPLHNAASWLSRIPPALREPRRRRSGSCSWQASAALCA